MAISRTISGRQLRQAGLAALAAAALLGAAQVAAYPSRAGAQAPESLPAAAAGTLSATGIGQIPGDAARESGALMMALEARSAAKDLQATVKSVQNRLATLQAALVAAGVPASAIHMQGFNIGPMYGYPVPMAGGAGVSEPAVPADAPVKPTSEPGLGGVVRPGIPVPPVPTSYTVNAQLMVDTTGPEQMAAAMRIALENGATNVNSFTKGGPGNPTPPDPARVAPAIRQATEQARAMAQASAEAAGVTLGSVQSVTVLPPTPSYGGGPGPLPTVTWQVSVRVTYALK